MVVRVPGPGCSPDVLAPRLMTQASLCSSCGLAMKQTPGKEGQGDPKMPKRGAGAMGDA